MALDERLRQELERAGRPADPAGVYEHLIRRRERRRMLRHAERGALAVAVVVGCGVGVFALSRVFEPGGEKAGIERPSLPNAPQNGLIVFSTPLEGEGEALMAVAPDGSGLRRLSPDDGADYRSPDVSPNGLTVAVVHESPSFESGQSALATVPIYGGSPSSYTGLDDRWYVFDPSWSPDGERIAFAGSPGGPFGIYVFDMRTGDVQLVPGTDEFDVGHPTWSSDGFQVAFEAWDGTQPQRWDLYSVRLDGSELTNLTDTPDVSETSPAWSWVRDQIAFVRSGVDSSGLFTIAPDGSDELLVTDALPAIASPAWSPDGTQIAFAANTGQVYTVGVDGTGLRPVVGALGEPAWQAVPEDGTIPPVLSPSVVPPPGPTGQDIGLGFPVCNVTSVSGTFAAGTAGTAYVATKAGDTGGCPEVEGGFQLVAVDVTGDGLADTSYGPLECDPTCLAFAAPDVDGDGTDELLVENIAFSIAGLRLYEVRTDPPEVLPVTVSTPGYPEGGLPAGAEPQFWIGGDGFRLDSLRCVADPAARWPRVLIQTSASQVPPDSTDSVWQATATWFALNPDGTLSIVDVGSFEEPIDQDGPTFAQDGGLCGAHLPYPYGGG